MKKVLLLTSPNVALTGSAPPILFIGSTEVLGGLEHFNYPTDYFDLNARLCKMYKSLSETDKEFLLDIESFIEFLKNPDYEHSVVKLAKELLLNIDLNEYDIFAISAIQWAYKHPLSVMTFHFAIILSMLLPKKTYIGGHALFEELGEDHIKKIIELPNSNVQTFLTGDGRENFPKFLNELNQKPEEK